MNKDISPRQKAQLLRLKYSRLKKDANKIKTIAEYLLKRGVFFSGYAAVGDCCKGRSVIGFNFKRIKGGGLISITTCSGCSDIIPGDVPDESTYYEPLNDDYKRRLKQLISGRSDPYAGCPGIADRPLIVPFVPKTMPCIVYRKNIPTIFAQRIRFQPWPPATVYHIAITHEDEVLLDEELVINS